MDFSGLMPIDFHSHFLPCMDDGSRSAEETRAMLDMMSAQGVKKVVATPHFYPDREMPSAFSKRREESVKVLKSVYKKTDPTVYLGAEVAYFKGISRAEEIVKFCIGETNYMLIEMPFSKWKPEVIDEILTLKDNFNINPILAHIECFLPYKNKKAVYFLKDEGVLIQSNGDYFIEKKTRKKALKNLNLGIIDLIGSDSHRADRRKPNLGEACSVIYDCFGEMALTDIKERGESVLKNAIPVLTNE